MRKASVVIICGGLGGARLAVGFREARLEMDPTFVVNVADDFLVDGALVCPDIDSVIYGLAGVFDDTRGWGISGDIATSVSVTYPWFSVGKEDRAYHLARQELVDHGMLLNEAIAESTRTMNLGATVLPATNAPVRTRIRSGTRTLEFQEWLVREGAEPPVDAVDYACLESAVPAPGVLEALENAHLILIGPSSPIASVMPVLGLAHVRSILEARRNDVVAIAPVVRRIPPVSPRDRKRAKAREALMVAAGVTADSIATAALYRPFIGTYVLDTADVADSPYVQALGLRVIVGPTIGADPSGRAFLNQFVATQLAVRVGA